MLTRRPTSKFVASLPFGLLLLFIVTLWLAGGASRADAAGQGIVRLVASLLLAAFAIFGPRPAFAPARPVWIIAFAALALVSIQLIPLPAEVWTSLPGRSTFLEASAASGHGQGWRPLTIVPSATINAATSLVVPLLVLLLVTSLNEQEMARLPGILLIAILASALFGLMQFSGSSLRNTLVSNIEGPAGGSFANRNHFALFMALGCLIAPVWMFMDGKWAARRIASGLGMICLFLLTILASGSRVGLVLSALALTLGCMLVQRPIRASLRGRPRWVLPAIAAGAVGALTLGMLLTLSANRAVSVERLLSLDESQDLRRQGLPIVVTMIKTYFPAGTGFGSFDPIFRLHEPFNFLSPYYFNHAHNDWLEIVLDGGLAGLMLLITATAWWVRASFVAWKRTGHGAATRARLGSCILFLVLIASFFDYPVRTPMIMAVTVIAAIWLCGGRLEPGSAALPRQR